MAMTDIDAHNDAGGNSGGRRLRSRTEHYRIMVLMLLPVFLLMLVGGSIMALGENADFTLLFLTLVVPVFVGAEFLMESAKPRILARPVVAAQRWFHDGLKAVLHLLPVGILVPIALADYSKGSADAISFMTNTWGLLFGIAFLVGASGMIRQR